MAIARVYDICWRAAYAELLPSVVLYSSSLADREELRIRLPVAPRDPRCAFVAEDNAGAVDYFAAA